MTARRERRSGTENGKIKHFGDAGVLVLELPPLIAMPPWHAGACKFVTAPSCRVLPGVIRAIEALGLPPAATAVGSG